jgi:hypothetical protein
VWCAYFNYDSYVCAGDSANHSDGNTMNIASRLKRLESARPADGQCPHLNVIINRYEPGTSPDDSAPDLAGTACRYCVLPVVSYSVVTLPSKVTPEQWEAITTGAK